MKNVAVNEEESKKNPKSPYCFDVESKDRTWMVSFSFSLNIYQTAPPSCTVFEGGACAGIDCNRIAA
jgi:hypothetical protein